MKKITWCGVGQSPYNDYLLSEVSKHFDLLVYYKIKKVSSHPWIFTSTGYNFKYIDQNFFDALKSIKDSNIIIVSGWSFWQHIIIMLIPFKLVKKIYWTDTPDLDKKAWSGLKGYGRKLLVKIVFKVFDQVWSTGKPGCEALIKLGCNKNKIKSFPFFLDLSGYNNINEEKYNEAINFRLKHTRPNTDIIFLCMGQLISSKRYYDAIKALKYTDNKHALLWLAGTGPQEKELKQLAKSLKIENQVMFLGWLQRSDVELSYIASDVFIHPSQFDPFPTVVLDAMTWGKPVIATEESGSAKDRVVNGSSGFLYPSGEIDKLITHMQFFIQNKDAIKAFGLEARKIACNYPVEVAIKQLNSVI